MRCLITGGAGFIGSHLVDLLVEIGNTVYVWDNLHRWKNTDTYHFNDKANYATVDITDTNLMFHPPLDAIFHLAAIPRLQHCYDSIEKALEVNYQGTVNMANLAIYKGTRFNHVSSCAIYEPYLNEYSYSKYLAESYIEYLRKQRSDTRTYNIARLGNVYGPREYDTLITKLKNSPYDIIQVNGDGKQKRNFVHVEDVVLGLLTMNEFHNVTCDFGNQVYSVNKLVKMFGKTPDYQSIPIPEMYKVKLNIKKTYHDIGWKPYKKLKDYV